LKLFVPLTLTAMSPVASAGVRVMVSLPGVPPTASELPSICTVCTEMA